MTDNKQTSQADLFDNPAVKMALKSMTLEQREHYQALGKELFGTVDFTDGRVINTLETPKDAQAQYILEGLRSGLLPSDLNDDEKEILEEVYGKKWYKDLGYTKRDLRK